MLPSSPPAWMSSIAHCAAETSLPHEGGPVSWRAKPSFSTRGPEVGAKVGTGTGVGVATGAGVEAGVATGEDVGVGVAPGVGVGVHVGSGVQVGSGVHVGAGVQSVGADPSVAEGDAAGPPAGPLHDKPTARSNTRQSGATTWDGFLLSTSYLGTRIGRAQTRGTLQETEAS